MGLALHLSFGLMAEVFPSLWGYKAWHRTALIQIAQVIDAAGQTFALGSALRFSEVGSSWSSISW